MYMYNESTLDWQQNLYITNYNRSEFRHSKRMQLSIVDCRYIYILLFIIHYASIIQQINEPGECQFKLYQSTAVR